MQDLSMITNGAKLKSVSAKLKMAGLGRVNVSLYTLNPEIFVRDQRVSSRFMLKVQDGIDAAIACGFGDIKLNYVIHNTNITDDFEKVVDFAGRRGLTLVLLPLLPYSFSTQDETVNLSDLKSMLIKYDILQEDTIVDQEGVRKCLLHLSNGAKVLLRSDELAWMEPYSDCISCDQYHLCREGIFPIRLTASGKLVPCLAGGKDFVDILPAIKFRNHAMILDVFESAIT